MAEMPSLDPESRNYISCPHCTIQIPADVAACPYCRQQVTGGASGKPKDIRNLLVPPERFPMLRKYYREHGKWVKVVAPSVLAVLLLWVAFEFLTRVRIVVPPDNNFLIEAKSERKDGGIVLLNGGLTNRGEDIPDLSLRSIGVTAEFLYRDGKTENRRVFPKSPFRGEGALLQGETGTFEILVPKGVKSVTLRGEIVNLGEDRAFVPSALGIRRLPARRRR
ncbi:MAG TPA: hypothetical protein DDX05_07570 [Deltaproteobacteria bacterium]|nr:MAG: hypothetical protein A2X90_00595 [Deltaproteobacteria bacterium GWA2_65_63]OGP28847.1 MAG: hypothetical protein A2X91_00020 [Deltaproteobacteria bacterium GWB2_65_81]OGP40744.1 MAG: hypothetical protein A2X98_05995 [Deltaproteobacteria bacterium GWC2_66_88]OGP79752.1 MAG: hypothetical protein A2Z26_05450 [Deltaproteobacteria bacterium RBG_16_66_15]HAM32882.1 hypothetical protein [Deltaproteobacteria bacterium]